MAVGIWGNKAISITNIFLQIKLIRSIMIYLGGWDTVGGCGFVEHYIKCQNVFKLSINIALNSVNKIYKHLTIVIY